jgi:glycosyltransferase involved in cell wall biosynthesis
MIGAGDPPPTFIRRQIAALERLDIQISVLPEAGSRRYLRSWLLRRGLMLPLSSEARSRIRAADMIHYQWPGHLLTYGVIARKTHKPAVLSLRGRQINIQPHMPGMESYAAALKRALPTCSAYHCVSEDIMREAIAYGLDPQRAWVIRPAVDTEFFTPADTSPSSPRQRVAMVGAFIWRKGYEYALLAFQEALQSGADLLLTIVGDGEERDRVEYTIADLDLMDRVELRGKLSPEGVRQTLRESHLFLHASLSEGIANVALEAMACGLPVISTDAGGMREAITNGVEGFLVPPRDTSCMAERLLSLSQDQETARQMGLQARERAVRDFNLRDQGCRFKEMYEKVLSR